MDRQELFTTRLAGEILVVCAQERAASMNWDDVESMSASITGSKDLRPMMVLNLGNVNYVGAVLLAFALRLQKYSRQHGGQLSLCSVSKSAKELLHITALDTIWPVHDSEEQAVAALSSSSATS